MLAEHELYPFPVVMAPSTYSHDPLVVQHGVDSLSAAGEHGAAVELAEGMVAHIDAQVVVAEREVQEAAVKQRAGAASG